MARDVLRVDGVSPETKRLLQESAQSRFGIPNASLLVRELIASHLDGWVPEQSDRGVVDAADTVRIELGLPRAAVEKTTLLAEARFSARNHYLASVILAHLGKPQLQGDEIEVLRRSNYEMAKVGNNLNQIAKAFNLLVNTGDGKLPEIGKKMMSLRRDIQAHTKRVLDVLVAGTTLWETKGRGQRPRRKAKRSVS